MTKKVSELDSIDLSEVSKNTEEMIQRVTVQNKPLALTEDKTAVAVLMGIEDYLKLQEKLEIAEELFVSQKQIVEGNVVDHEKVRRTFLGKQNK